MKMNRFGHPSKAFYLNGKLRECDGAPNCDQLLFWSTFLKLRIRPDCFLWRRQAKRKPCKGIEKKRNHSQTVPLSFFCFLKFRAFLESSSLLIYLLFIPKRMALFLMLSFVRNSQFLSTFCPSVGQNSSSAGARHPGFKTVLISSLSSWRLKCAFHCLFYSNKINGLQRYKTIL